MAYVLYHIRYSVKNLQFQYNQQSGSVFHEIAKLKKKIKF